MRRRGFTLIELLVAMAIGAVVCGTAFAAVRAAGHAFTVGTRLSVENQLMRSGVYAALDELDTWRYYDDPGIPSSPNPPASTPLRGAGNPFAPQAFAEDYNLEFLPMRDAGTSYEDWWRRDSRCWWRGDPTSEDDDARMKLLGNFALFGTIATSDGTSLGGAERRWYHKLVKNLSTDLGYYALLDMAPPCLMATYFDPAADWRTTGEEAGVVPQEFFAANHGGPGSVGTSWWDDRPHDFVALTLGGFYTIGIPSRALNVVHNIPDLNRSMFLTWLAEGGSAVNPGWTADDAFNSIGGRLSVIPVKPAQWPDLHVTVRHYIANARNFHAAYIMLQSPQTGQDFKLRFSYTGTKRRGARRQRTWPQPLEPAYSSSAP